MTRDGTTEHVSRDQILRCERGKGDIHFLCSADHEQDWPPYPVDPYSTIFVETFSWGFWLIRTKTHGIYCWAKNRISGRDPPPYCMYGQRFQQSMDQPGMVANPARGHLKIWSCETCSAIPTRVSPLILHP